MATRRGTCRNCLKDRRIQGRGLCTTCYENDAIREKFPPLTNHPGFKTEAEYEADRARAQGAIGGLTDAGLMRKVFAQVPAGDKTPQERAMRAWLKKAPDNYLRRMLELEAADARGPEREAEKVAPAAGPQATAKAEPDPKQAHVEELIRGILNEYREGVRA